MKIVKPAQFKEAVAKLGGRSPVGSKLTSEEWARVPLALRERAFFSATIENAQFLQRSKELLGDTLTSARETLTLPDGTNTTALKVGGRAKFVEEARRFAIAEGMGPLDPKDIGSIKDIRSESRLNLIYDVQTSAAYEFGGWKQGLDPDVLDEFPAQRFIRESEVKEPRDLHQFHEGEVHLKSDIDFWTGINRDFGVPWGPWGWGCGHGVEDVDRGEAEALGLIAPGQAVESPEAAFNEKLKASVRGLDADLVAWLKESLGDAVAVQGDAMWWKGDRASKALAVDPKPRPTGPAPFPTDPAALKVVRPLGGSTGADLVRDRGGNLWVRKLGKNEAHLREEFAADALYRAAGLDVPEGRIYEQGGRPVKLTRFVQGESLGEYLAKASPEQQARVLDRIRAGFAADALLGNWDVAGLSMDNILVDAAGTPWRIDNGGSLRFRAQGAPKTAAQFGPKVLEWETLRDAATNPQTARVFAGLTAQELEDQVRAIASRRQELLAAAPEAVRATLDKRIDDLLSRLKPVLRIESEEFGREVAQSRILGKAHAGDADKVEDLHVLFYTEERDGQDVTVARWKLTPTGGEAVRGMLGRRLQAEPPADDYWPTVLAGVKTANKHAADGAYNKETLTKLNELKYTLHAAPPGKAAMASHYLGIIGEVEKAVAARKSTRSGIEKYVAPKTSASSAPDEAWTAVSFGGWTFSAKSRQRGKAQTASGDVYKVADAAVLATHRNGVQMHLVLPDNKQVPYALRGTVEMVAPGKGGKAATAAIAQAARDLGVPLDDSSPARREITYIARNLGAIRKTLTAGQEREWQAIYAAELDEPAKAQQLRAWVQSRLKVDVADPSVYRPEGQANSFGYGFMRWDRFDLPRAKVEKGMAGYTLHHETFAEIDELVGSFLDGGGQVTPTVERIRTGVAITAGMSTTSDLASGGASYFFTRIRPQASARKPGLTFKIGNLARIDAYSFSKDAYGDIRPVGENTHHIDPPKDRALSVAEYKKFAKTSDNETNFKHGLHLLDDVEKIYVRTAAQRDKVLKVFTSHGYQALPDGRKVEDVVEVV